MASQAKTGVTYQDAPYRVKVHELEWQQRGLQQTASGYGRKLVTPYMLQLPTNPHWYRVYAICWSNAASYYILRGGEELFLRGGELDEARELARGEGGQQ